MSYTLFLDRGTTQWYIKSNKCLRNGQQGFCVRAGKHKQEYPGADKIDKNEFSKIRHCLGKTQNQMAQLLGASGKAVQSFEQGWRTVPVHTERQMLFLLALKNTGGKKTRPCWEIRQCPQEIIESCPAWELHAGQLCWFISGTICRGKVQRNWHDKLQICRGCPAYPILLQPEEVSQQDPSLLTQHPATGR